MDTHTRILKEDLMELRTIQNASGLTTIAETIHHIMHPSEQRAFTLVKLLEKDFEKLQRIKNDCGFQDLGYVIHQILESQSSNEMASVSKVMKESVPMVLCGKPLSGKSHWCKNVLIPSLNDYPLLLIDTVNEYSDLKEIKTARELNLNNKEHVRFCPSQHSIMGTMQIKGLFTKLNMMIDIDKETLKNLVIIIEEAQTYKSSWFNGFLYRSRHQVRKMIVVTPQTDCFQGLKTLTIFR